MSLPDKMFGVFLPIANGGWIISNTTPELNGLYEQNKKAAQLADKIGLDFIMSMSKFRGFGGETNHWGVSMESMTMMAGLAEATENVKVWTTMHSLLHNPAVVAKMVTTLDHISNGRAGLNIVSGAYIDEFKQMGAWREDVNHDERYDLADEWITVIKKLWSEDHIDFDGKYFKMEDCEHAPKPISRPRPDIISAGQSDRGLNFATKHADACFIAGRDMDQRLSYSRRAREIADENERTIKVCSMCTVIHDDTDEKALKRLQKYEEGRDMGAIMKQMESWGLQGDNLLQSAKKAGCSQNHTVVGSPETCRQKIEELVEKCEIDGVMLIYPEYEEGLEMTGTEILPHLRQRYSALVS